jgi:hypothetical protein
MTEAFSHDTETEVKTTSSESHEGLVEQLLKLTETNRSFPIDITDIVSKYVDTVGLEYLNRNLMLCGNLKIFSTDNGHRYLLTHSRAF